MHFFWKRLLFFLAAMAFITGFCCVSVLYFADVQETGNFSDRDRILVLDAGHGGEDGGAVSASGLVEAGINLDITRRIQALALLAGVPVQMTRETAEIDYPESAHTTAQRKVADQKQRVAQINALPNAVLISIHQNCYPGSAKPFGAQVLYAATDGSETLGSRMHENLITYLNPDNRRVAAPISDKIYLMRSVHCPAVLVECGFLSNPEEASKLVDSGYQTKLATVILASYLQYRDNPM